MKDLKFKKYVPGLGGADCILCKTQAKDWIDKEQIEQGFPINLCADDTLNLYNSLIAKDGEIVTKQGDFSERLGLTNKPLSNSDQMNITVTHSYINVTSWFLKVLYRCNAKYHQSVD